MSGNKMLRVVGTDESFIASRQNAPQAGVNAGGALIVIIIAVLCVCVFGVLSFVSAYSDRRLAEITRNSAEQYYLAEKQMEGELALLDEALGQAQDLPLEDVLSDAAERMSDASFSAEDGKITLTNTVKYADNKQLTAILQIYTLGDNTAAFEIISWRTSPIEAPDYGQGKELWDGES